MSMLWYILIFEEKVIILTGSEVDFRGLIGKQVRVKMVNTILIHQITKKFS